MKHQDPRPGGTDSFFETYGSVARGAYDQYVTSAVPNTNSQQIPSYHPTSASQDTYQNMNEQQVSYSIRKTQQGPYPHHQGTYSDVNGAYRNSISAPQGSYQY